jgi:hypothetical protein
LLPSEGLQALRAAAEVVREENTSLSGMIRVFDLDGEFFVQEETPDRTFLVRPRPSLDEALAFVDRRLQTYERMWDG